MDFNKVKHFIFDVDDTLVDCNGELVRIIERDYKFVCPLGTYLNHDNSNGHHGAVLASAEFMRTAPMLPHAKELLVALVDIKAAGYNSHICTHRGYHADALKHTEDMLADYEATHLFDDIHVLDFNTVPDKVAYLDSVYGVGTYILFDDRPRYDLDHPLPDHIWLFDQPWNQHMTGNRTTHVLDTIRSILEVA